MELRRETVRLERSDRRRSYRRVTRHGLLLLRVDQGTPREGYLAGDPDGRRRDCNSSTRQVRPAREEHPRRVAGAVPGSHIAMGAGSKGTGGAMEQIGRASGRERVCQYVEISG